MDVVPALGVERRVGGRDLTNPAPLPTTLAEQTAVPAVVTRQEPVAAIPARMLLKPPSIPETRALTLAPIQGPNADLGLVEIVQLLDGRQPELGMLAEHAMQPGGAGPLRTDHHEIRAHRIVGVAHPAAADRPQAYRAAGPS